jgi:transposase
MARIATTNNENPVHRREGMIIYLERRINQTTRRCVMPSNTKNSSTVSVVHEISCGLDVHKDTVSACLLYSDSAGVEQSEVIEFQTFTDDLIKLKEWLLDRECLVVAMESTGPYWTPIHNVLEGSVRVVLVNARHMRNVPGRKTDIADSKWLAGLLRHGLLKAAYIPPKNQRHWRDLTRMRKKYKEDLGDFKRRVHKLFQQANIKIDSVLSDLFGATGRNLMTLLISRESCPALSEVEDSLRGSLKNNSEKAPELHRSIQGFFETHHRFLLSLLLDTIKNLETQISLLESRINQVMMDFAEQIERLEEIPGVSEISSHAILAEIGPTLEDFTSAHALASWCGLSPGNNQSGGKRFSGKSQVRKNHLKTIMVEVAWPAIKTRGSYYRAKYYSLKAHLGPKKAIIAVAHRILKAIYHILKDGVRFKDLGEAYLLERKREAKIKYLTWQASLLGYELVPLNQPASVQATQIFS